jgi:hypothetical protein
MRSHARCGPAAGPYARLSRGSRPDHYARLAAVGRLVQILTAGRPLPKREERKEERRSYQHRRTRGLDRRIAELKRR